MKTHIVAKWINAETDRPSHGDKIIFIDNVGMYMGIFYSDRSGVVHVEGKMSDVVEWENVFEWIYYPVR